MQISIKKQIHLFFHEKSGPIVWDTFVFLKFCAQIKQTIGHSANPVTLCGSERESAFFSLNQVLACLADLG
jgi:hypothetical protein